MTSLSPAAAGTGRGAEGPKGYAHLIGRLQLSPPKPQMETESKRSTCYQTANNDLLYTIYIFLLFKSEKKNTKKY